VPAYFGKEFFRFFRELASHNDRDWFQANRERYEASVRQPLLKFIGDLGAPLAKINPHFRATPRSLMRINRDIRFSKDKSPYRTHAGMHFGHDGAGESPGPGFYLHLGPKDVFSGAGIWMPDSPTLQRIRNGIVEKESQWRKATRPKGKSILSSGHDADSLKRPPKGFDPDHPFIEDLKRKHFITGNEFSEAAAVKAGFLNEVIDSFREAAPLMRFLTEAVGLQW
jgi:uncharacterized protein (TIGR02453 family)